MEPVQELRERQRLYVPTRSALRPDDHPWRPAGQGPDYLPPSTHRMPIRAAALALIFALNFLLPVAPPVLETLILLVDVAGVILLFDTLNKLWYAVLTRAPRLRWTTFPAFTGGRLEAVLVARPSPEIIGPVLAVLRCVRDEQVGEESGGERAPVAIYRQAKEFPVPGERLRDLPLAFDIPADLPGTELGREDATYWQIHLRIPVLGPDVELVYLAPVYTRPGHGLSHLAGRETLTG
jgi:hypothetical protein